MSVYTQVNPDQLTNFLTRFRLGKLHQLVPITAGVTNTNYYLDCEAGRYVLTLFEQQSKTDLDYTLGLQCHLNAASVACARPEIDRSGALYSTLNDRPASIIGRLDGTVVDQATVEQMASIAIALAQFHLAGQSFDKERANTRDVPWLLATCNKLSSELDGEEQKMIQTCLQDFHQNALPTLPRGAVHADLFRDNALFDGNRLSGIIDFDYACSDSFIFDLAILINDWCVDGDGELLNHKVSIIFAAYQSVRPLTAPEWDALVFMLQIAALRFWISRLYDKAFPPSGKWVTQKNPEIFMKQFKLRTQRKTEISQFRDL